MEPEPHTDGEEGRVDTPGCKPDEVSVTLRTESVEKAETIRRFLVGKTGSHKSPIKKEQDFLIDQD